MGLGRPADLVDRGGRDRGRGPSVLSKLGGEVERRLADFLGLLELVTPDEGEGGDDPDTRDDGAGDERVGESVDQCAGHCRSADTASPVRVVAMVESAAIPSAPPICCDVLMRPDASPASAGSTPARAAIVIGTNEKPIPTPMSRNPGRRSLT